MQLQRWAFPTDLLDAPPMRRALARKGPVVLAALYAVHQLLAEQGGEAKLADVPVRLCDALNIPLYTEAEEIMNCLLDNGLLYADGQTLGSLEIDRQLEATQRKSDKARASAAARWHKGTGRQGAA